MLLYLTKHSRSDNTNSTQEFSKVDDGANSAAFCELVCMINYVHDMKSFRLKMESSGNMSEP